MIVNANILVFATGASKKLKLNDQVRIASGMGGCYTLMILNIEDEGVTLGGRKDQDIPSYLNDKFCTWDELEAQYYMLMPSLTYGLFQEHINIAKAAGYLGKESIIHAIAKTNDFSDSFVELMFNRSKHVTI